MVDFNNEATISTPATEVIKIEILERRYNLIEAVEAYNKQIASGVQAETGIVKARLLSLFMEVHPALERGFKSKDREELLLLLDSDEFRDLMRGFFIINAWLDKVRLTRIDNKAQYDRTITEEENKATGL